MVGDGARPVSTTGYDVIYLVYVLDYQCVNRIR